MTVPTSGAGAHQPAQPTPRSIAEKRTASGVEKPQIRAVPSSHTTTSSSSSCAAMFQVPSYLAMSSADLRPDSPLPALIPRSLLVGRGEKAAQPRTRDSDRKDGDSDSPEALVPGGPPRQASFMEQLARAMPYLELQAKTESKARASAPQLAVPVYMAGPATSGSSSTSSSSSATPPASLEQRLAAARDVVSLNALEGEALAQASKARREVFDQWAASLSPQALVRAFRQVGASLLLPLDDASTRRSELRLALWQMTSLTARMSTAQCEAELEANQDIQTLTQASQPSQMLLLMRARFIALHDAQEPAARQAALAATRDVTTLLSLAQDERRLTLQVRAEQFKAHSFLGQREQAIQELAQLRRPGVMVLMDNELLACETELREVEFQGWFYYLSPADRSAEIRKALDPSVLRKLNAQAWDRTLRLRDCEFAACAGVMGQSESAQAFLEALVPENLGTMLEAGQERTLQLRIKLVRALMQLFRSDTQLLGQALAGIKDPMPLALMSSQRLGHALRLRKEAFDQWIQSQPEDQRAAIVREELAEAFDVSRLTRLTVPLQASVGMLRLSLAEVAMRHL